MENFHKSISYVGMMGLVLISICIIKYFLGGETILTEKLFAIGMLLMIIPTIARQVTIPMGQEDVHVAWIAVMYVIVFPFVDAIAVICFKSMIGALARGGIEGFPFIGVLVIYFITMFMGFGIKILKGKVN